MELTKRKNSVAHLRAGDIIAYGPDFLALTKWEPAGRGYIMEGISLLKARGSIVKLVALSSEEFDEYIFPR